MTGTAHCARLWPWWRGAVVAATLLAAATVRAAAPVSPKTLFFHANALYKDGQYGAAAAEYEQILHAGLASGNLYFNLGNAYFKSGAKGKAILNYERARRLLPGDPDVAANLGYTQQLTGAERCVPALWERVAFPLARRLATGTLVWTVSGLYTASLLAAIAYRLWPRRARGVRYAASVAAALLLVATGSLAWHVAADDWQRQAVVTQPAQTPARFEPAADGTVYFVLKEGERVRVVDVRQGWLEVARCDGRRGWIPRASAEDL